MGKRKTFDDIKKIVADAGYYLISETKINKNNVRAISVECDKKHTYTVALSNFIDRKSRCPKCKGIQCSQRQTKPLEEIRKWVSQNTPYICSTGIEQSSSNVKLKCARHGTFVTTLYKLKKKGKCPKCSSNYKLTVEAVKDWLHLHSKYTLKGNYTSATSKSEFVCKKHGNFKTKFTYIKAGHQCPKCGTEERARKNSNNIATVKEKVFQKGYILLSNTYINNRSNLKLQCEKHGLFEHTLHGLKRNSCPKCYTSKENLEILDYIHSLSIKPSLNNRKIIPPKELDIYIEECKLGIEYNGLYWHSDLYKTNKYHFDKYQDCKKKNINLLGIYADEWQNQKDLIKAMIKHRLGKLPKNKFRASKLKIKKLVKNKEFSSFFNQYHLDGHTQASFAYGLFFNNKMVSCASFRRNGRDKCWEIARFASNYNYHIYGSLGKVLKLYKKEYNERLITYSNNRLSHGNVYKTLGFEEITAKYNKPSYWYTDLKKRVFRTRCKKINDLEMLKKYPTEKEQALAGLFSVKNFGHDKPLYKIYDYGHRKWELK